MKKLIGSAPTLEALNELINKYFFTRVQLKKIENEDRWALFNSKGLLGGCHVIKAKNRYRFERCGD